MNRRALLASLAAASLLSTRLALGRAPQRVFRIGIVGNTEPNTDIVAVRNTHPAPRIIEARLRELGWVDGKNVQILWKSEEGQSERRPGIIDEFVRMPVDVLVVFGAPTARMALQKTRTIPVVALGNFLAAQGLVASLAKPGGNLTGLSWESLDAYGKIVQLLKTAVPRLTRVAFVTRVAQYEFDTEVRKAASDLGVSIFQVRYEDAAFERAVAEAAAEGANGLVFQGTPQLTYRDVQLRAHAVCLRWRLPAIHTVLSAVESGGLMGWGVDDEWVYSRFAYFIDRLLRGAKAADLPIEQADKIELRLNLGTARQLGLTFPASLITQAERVFQ